MIKDTKVNREKVDWLLEQPVDVQVSIMQQHLDICKLVINSLLRTNVESLAGSRYCRVKPYEGRYSRWGYNPGSVKVGNQKLPIDVPRIYDREGEKHFNAPVYDKMRKEAAHSEEMVNSVLHGISMRDYGQVATQLIDSFGLSPATISRQFVAKSKEAIEAFFTRSLEEYPFVAMFVDGKHLAAQQMIIALGITDKGQKIPLSVIQTSTENSTVIGQMFQDLISRGLAYEHGILFIIDGSKGIHKAINEVFGAHAVIQRCQWHKRENVVSYLREDLQEHYRKQMQRAYQEPEYRLAKAQLLSLGEELKKINLSAARSLEEGLEETLTLHRLKLADTFSRSFATTNCIESINSQIGKYTRKIKRWVDSEQRYRWVVSALMEIEHKLHKVSGFRQLHQLADAVGKQILVEPKNFN